MTHCICLDCIKRYAINLWRFRKKPELAKLYASHPVDYMPTMDVMVYADLDVRTFPEVESIKVRLRAFDIWFEVREKSGVRRNFCEQLSKDDSEQAYRLSLSTELERSVRGITKRNIDKLFGNEWERLLRKVVRSYDLECAHIY